jgi:hypothetical protein
MNNAAFKSASFLVCILASLVALASCVSPEVVIPKCEMTIVHSYPSDRDTGIKTDSEALVVFSQEVATDVVEKHVYVDRSLNGSWVAEPITYTYEMKDSGFYVQMISQGGTWVAATTYRVTVNAGNGIPSKDGNCVLTTGTEIVFTTAQ